MNSFAVSNAKCLARCNYRDLTQRALYPPDQPRQEIQITLPDGSHRHGKSWETTPMAIAKEISASLSQRIVIAKVHIFIPSFSVCFTRVYICYSR